MTSRESLPDVDAQSSPYAHSYHVFTSDEFDALASAAAYATAALTSASLSRDGTDSSDWRPLTAEQQSTIAEQLKAWAGLEGPEKQVEARLSLEKRQAHIVSSLHGNQTEEESSTSMPSAEETSFFPPDFASHYRTQLRSLAEGYYTRLYKDAVDQSKEEKKASDQQPPKLQSSSIQPVLEPSQQGLPPGVSSAQDPMQILAAASNAAGLDVQSPQLRDQLLQYAHGLYSTGSTVEDSSNQTILHPTLLPLLHTLHDLQPQHLPTLLLLSCAYYTSGNHAGSLYYNNTILEKDPNYVEAMSNIGTTLRALGRWKEAEGWWWKAVKLRPGYWDAYENLLGVLCFPQQQPSENPEPQGPRFSEALQLCDLVESSFASKKKKSQSILEHPSNQAECMPSQLPLAQVPRMQNLYYAKGNLKYVVKELGSVPAAVEYQKAVEICLSPSESSCYSLRDLVVATCVVGLLSMGAVVPGSAAATAAFEVAAALGLDPSNAQHASLAASGMFSSLAPGGILRLVRRSGDHLVRILLRLGGGQLPMIMLLPEPASRLTLYLFAETGGVLPSMAKNQNNAPPQEAANQATQTTSTILLTLAKLLQDAAAKPIAGPHGNLTLGGIPASISLVLPLYYLSLSLSSSASTCNNAGILLSSIPVVTTVINAQGQAQQLNGQALAMQYYMHGLSIDPKHPHLYTNLGSLLKDLGHLNEAVQMYEKAVECNPTFDVALANVSKKGGFFPA